jgi:hypothetical protein
MAEPTPKLRDISWGEICPWLILLRSIRIALLARVLILGAAGLIATTIGWRVVNWVFQSSTDPVLQEWREDANRWIWEPSATALEWRRDREAAEGALRELDLPAGVVYFREPSETGFSIDMSARSVRDVYESAQSDILQAPLELWLYLTRPFQELFDADLTPMGFLCLLLCCVWAVLVWGVAGGAISRIAALRFTRGEAPGLVAAVAHAVAKLPSYCSAPLIALAGAALFAVQLFVVGLLMNVSLFAVLAAVVWPFVLLLGLLMAVLLVGALVGWPLMWATVAVEGTDSFDALSRGYAYVYQRPWRLLWYVIVAVFLAAVSMFVVKVFATSAIALGDWSVSWGLGDEKMAAVVAAATPETAAGAPSVAPPADPITDDVNSGPQFPTQPAAGTDPPQAGAEAAAGTEPTQVDAPNSAQAADGDANAEPGVLLPLARTVIGFWKSLLAALAAGYQAGFLWVSAVGVYLLLRRDIDGAEMDEVFVEQADEFGLPPLEDDAATGVPQVSSGGAAAPGNTSMPS